MTPEQLMKPRYKVIADYPRMEYDQLGKDDVFEVNHSNAELQKRQLEYFNKYSHLFRGLHWWEGRRPETMPLYVRNAADGIVFKLLEQSKHTPSDAWVACGGNTGWHSLYDLLPATEAEYLAQQ